MPAVRGGLLALTAAVLFGISTPLVQKLGAGVGAFMTAASLYSGAALAGALLRQRVEREARVASSDIRRLLAMVAAGAVIGPVALAGPAAGSRIGVEATGSYHELFADAAHELGFWCSYSIPRIPATMPRPLDCAGRPIGWMPLIARMIAHEHTKLHAWIISQSQFRPTLRQVSHKSGTPSR